MNLNLAAMVMACSGPGAGHAIGLNIRAGYGCAAFGVLVTLALFYLQRFRGGRVWPLASGIVLLAIHPAWTIRATGGDCGMLKLAASWFVSFLFIGLLIFQLAAASRRSGDSRSRDGSKADAPETTHPS